MTVHSVSLLVCDGCDAETFQFDGPHDVTRRAATDIGWQVGEIDLCPSCRPLAQSPYACQVEGCFGERPWLHDDLALVVPSGSRVS